MISVLIAFDYFEDILQIVYLLILLLLILIHSRKKRCFQLLAKFNKLISPSLIYKGYQKIKKVGNDDICL